MKAAILNSNGELKVTEVAEPAGDVVTVKAVALKHFDKSRAAGKHYSCETSERQVIGSDGVCLLSDGSRVYSMGITGMLAEKALIHRDRLVPVPSGLDDATAAALPNAVIGSAMALRFKADIQPGDTVLINGATGFTGRVAVQLAKYYGAKTVIATGRNSVSLNELLTLGANKVILIDEAFSAHLKALQPVDIIIDYLWGATAEMILAVLKGDGSYTQKVRYVLVGSISGDLIRLSAACLRSVNMRLTGSGLGAWTKPQVGLLFKEILPETFALAADGKLQIATTTVTLAELENFSGVPAGRRLVVML